ncbi:myocardin [Pimephales promelas]|uniref:myocardin n=1 Tax=Pimephales promelas TaxID=90988 RepID=UPI0019555B40|nr:myocardin [Pimephales promelas]
MTLLGSEHSVLIRSKFKSVLQLRLQQRRTREQLEDQGIMPPLKSPASFHEQRKSLERSKTGDYLKHKIRSRPEKSELVSMHILQDTVCKDSQNTLKRARFADDLKEKISLRPGPLELVEKNIISVHSTLKQAVITGSHGKLQRPEDSYVFEEESSSESLSPESPSENKSSQTHTSAEHLVYITDTVCKDSQNTLKRARFADDLKEKISLRPGPLELVEKNIISVHSTLKQAVITGSHGKLQRPEDSYVFEEESSSESLSPESPSENKSSPTHTSAEHGPQSNDGSAQTPEDNMSDGQGTTPIPVQAMVKSKVSEKNRHKKPKDIKPKVKKLKYHQYIPPDQKAERSPPAQMDSAYARLLQQQQIFLQLQILSQQKHTHSQTHSQTSFSYQINQHKSSGEQQASCASAGSSSSSSSPVKSNYCSPSSINSISPAPLPNNLDDLKVSELRQQLRIRGLPVSGTKTSLIERLRPFKDSSCASPSGSGDVSTGPFPATPGGSSYQSPASHGPGFYPFCSSGSSPPISPASSDLSLPDSFSDGTLSSPHLGPDAEKDKMLVEKQKVIEELRWKLQQEQRQVEELRFELHKRSRECPVIMEPPVQVPQGYGVSVKQEHVSSSCPLSSEQGTGVCVGHCDPGLSAFMSPQCSPQESPVTKPSASPQPESPVQPFLLRDSHRPARSMQADLRSVSWTLAERRVSCAGADDRHGLRF